MLHKCLFLSFFLNIILAAEVTKTDSTLNKNPKTAFYLSTVPGGGQLYNGKLLKGSLVFALESFAIYSWLENAKIYRDYDTAYKPLPKNRYLEKRNKSLGFLDKGKPSLSKKFFTRFSTSLIPKL